MSALFRTSPLYFNIAGKSLSFQHLSHITIIHPLKHQPLIVGTDRASAHIVALHHPATCIGRFQFDRGSIKLYDVTEIPPYRMTLVCTERAFGHIELGSEILNN